MKIVIDEEVQVGEMPSLLEYIQGLVSEGYTSGYYPHWHLED